MQTKTKPTEMKSTIILAALALTASASPLRGLRKAHNSADSYEGKHCDTNDFLYKCSDMDPAQMYTCGPAGYQATWKKMPRCTGGTVCKADGVYAGCVNPEDDDDYSDSDEHDYNKKPTPTEDYSYNDHKPTTKPSYEYKSNNKKPDEDNSYDDSCYNFGSYRCQGAKVQQCAYVEGPKLAWRTLDTCNAGKCGQLDNGTLGCPQQRKKSHGRKKEDDGYSKGGVQNWGQCGGKKPNYGDGEKFGPYKCADASYHCSWQPDGWYAQCVPKGQDLY